jgi:hypothetical protein
MLFCLDLKMYRLRYEFRKLESLAPHAKPLPLALHTSLHIGGPSSPLGRELTH